jgi:opine dehydrogenase
MRVAILGAGSIGFGTAAFLAESGHHIVLWSPSGNSTRDLRDNMPLQATGAVEGAFSIPAESSCERAVHEAEVVLIAVPGYGHKAVIDQAVPHLRDDQTIIIRSHCSLSALYLSKQLAERKLSTLIVAWGTTLVTGRKRSGNAVNVSNVRKKVDIATVPAHRTPDGLDICRLLFGDRFNAKEDILAVSLSNLNPEAHLGVALCNLTRIERGEEWVDWEGTTETVGRLNEDLDRERLALASRLGDSVRTTREHFHYSYGVPLENSIAETARVMEQRDRGLGPRSLDTRYITEDIPFGFVPSVLMGKLIGVPMPLHEAGIAIVSSLYGRDFESENDILPELGLTNLSESDFLSLARQGWMVQRSSS